MTNTLGDFKSQYYNALGYTGSISDMEYAYYSNPPAGGGGFTKVANAAALPAPSGSNAGAPYYITDTSVTVVSDGTRWRTMYGDTGQRTISTWDSAGVVTGTPLHSNWKPRTSNGGYIRMRRTNNVVFLYTDNLACAVANPGNAFIVVPAGFVPDVTAATLVSSWTPGNTYSACGLTASSSGNLLLTLGFTAVIDQYFLAVGLSWLTKDPWPTTLPGTAFTQPN